MQLIAFEVPTFGWNAGMVELTYQPRHTKPARLGLRKPNRETLLPNLDRQAQDLFPPWPAYNIFPARPFSV